MNPSHKQKKSKEDAPQWYIDACIDAMTNGLGVIVIRFDGKDYEIKHIKPAVFLELSDALIQLHSQFKEQT